MDDSVYNRLRETGWRRKLNSDEEAELRVWLATRPDLQSEWETDAALNEFLSRLSHAPVSSNFTARVLQAAGTTGASERASSRHGPGWNWRAFLPRTAAVCALLLFSFGAYRYHEVTQREKLARRVANVSDMVALSSPEVFQDFETVRHLNQTPAADEELLALLQ